MKRPSVWITVSLITLSTGSLWADPRSFEFTLAPGYALPLGDTSDFLNSAPSLDGSVYYGVLDGLSVGVELGYIFGAKFEGTVPEVIFGDIDSDGVNDHIGFTSDMHLSVLHITPELKIGPTLEANNAQIRPYCVGGGGWYRSHLKAGTLTLNGITSSGLIVTGTGTTTDSLTENNGGFNVGAGVDVQIKSNWRIGADVRYHHIIYKDGPDTTFLIPSLRLTWFGI